MQSKIERQVMASIGVIYGIRRLVSATALKVYALVVSLYALGILVWVERIEENFLEVMNGGVLAVGNFVLSAVTHTSGGVLLVFVAALAAFISLFLDLAHTLAFKRTPSY